LRAKALRDRWAEEYNLVVAEMDWTENFFLYKAEQWLARMAVADQQHKWGHKAYAAKQANMYRSMALKALEAFQKAKGVVAEGGDLLGAAEGPGWEDSD
jgi:hypothetical protein